MSRGNNSKRKLLASLGCTTTLDTAKTEKKMCIAFDCAVPLEWRVVSVADDCDDVADDCDDVAVACDDDDGEALEYDKGPYTERHVSTYLKNTGIVEKIVETNDILSNLNFPLHRQSKHLPKQLLLIGLSAEEAKVDSTIVEIFLRTIGRPPEDSGKID